MISLSGLLPLNSSPRQNAKNAHMHTLIQRNARRICGGQRGLYLLPKGWTHFSLILLFIQPQLPTSPSLRLYVSLSPAPSFFYLSLRPLLPPSPGLTSRLRLLGECYYSITLHLDNHRLATPNWSRAGWRGVEEGRG